SQQQGVQCLRLSIEVDTASDRRAYGLGWSCVGLACDARQQDRSTLMPECEHNSENGRMLPPINTKRQRSVTNLPTIVNLRNRRARSPQNQACPELATCHLDRGRAPALTGLLNAIRIRLLSFVVASGGPASGLCQIGTNLPKQRSGIS